MGLVMSPANGELCQVMHQCELSLLALGETGKCATSGCTCETISCHFEATRYIWLPGMLIFLGFRAFVMCCFVSWRASRTAQALQQQGWVALTCEDEIRLAAALALGYVAA